MKKKIRHSLTGREPSARENILPEGRLFPFLVPLHNNRNNNNNNMIGPPIGNRKPVNAGV